MTLLAALAGALAISFSAIFYGLAEVPPITGAFFRMFYALPLLFLLWWVRRDDDRRTPRKRLIAFGAGLLLGLDVVVWHVSIEHIGAGLATLIANTQVIFVAIGAWILLRERPSRQVGIAIPVVLAGVALVSGLGRGDSFGTNPLLGSLLALIAAVFYAAYILGYRNSNSIQAPSAGPLMEASAGAALAAVVAGAVGGGMQFAPTWPAHGWLLALALISQLGGWLLIGYALPRLPAAETATIILLQPVLTMIWGAMILGERPSPTQILGAAVVMAGVGFVAVTNARKARVPVAPAG